MRFACSITKATDTHLEYAIFIAFPLQQWLHERASMLRYTYTACLVLFFSTRIKFVFENRAVYEIIWKNIVQPGRSQTTIWRMRFACWITKATDTHLEYAIFIAFPLQQWLHERASMLRYTYTACLAFFSYQN